MKIFLANALSGNIDEFVPVDPKHIRMYVCGPTVYDTPHVGNARPLVIFDVLFRFLMRVYPSVSYVRNITDVDDKINNKARDLGIPIRTLTDGIIEKFHSFISQLNILPVTYEPRATDHITEMIDIINTLIENGYAYQAEGHVLYRVRKNENYGVLSKRNLDDMRAGNRVEIAPYKEDPMDFVLWKPSEEGQPAWDSPFGRGRPGWHIECSAMSSKYLGVTFDIHAGGRDLEFPHHENEMAQNYGAFGCRMANYWLHNGMILVDGRKMSKSLGNIIRLDDALSQYDGEIIRYALLSTHYQKTLDWTDSLLHESKTSLDRLYNALDGDINGEHIDNSSRKVCEVLANNLNTPAALRELRLLADDIRKSSDRNEQARMRGQLLSEARLLGLLQHSPAEWFKRGASADDAAMIEDMIERRKEAKTNKDYQLADQIRQQLLEIGVVLEDGRDGSTTWKKS